jgi:hypothetical protein
MKNGKFIWFVQFEISINASFGENMGGIHSLVFKGVGVVP